MVAPDGVKVHARSDVQVSDSCNDCCRCWPWRKKKHHKRTSTEIKIKEVGSIIVVQNPVGPSKLPQNIKELSPRMIPLEPTGLTIPDHHPNRGSVEFSPMPAIPRISGSADLSKQIEGSK